MAEHLNRLSLMDRAYALWESFCNDYEKLVEKYESLLQEKRKRKMTLDKIKVSELRDEDPQIELLGFQTEDEAKKYLESLDETELSLVILDIENYLGSYIRITLTGKIDDYNIQIKLHDAPKSAYAMNPDACGCGKRSCRPRYGLNADS